MQGSSSRPVSTRGLGTDSLKRIASSHFASSLDAPTGCPRCEPPVGLSLALVRRRMAHGVPDAETWGRPAVAICEDETYPGNPPEDRSPSWEREGRCPRRSVRPRALCSSSSGRRLIRKTYPAAIFAGSGEGWRQTLPTRQVSRYLLIP